MKKIILISCLICLLLCGLGYGAYSFVLHQSHKRFVAEIITRLGGEGEIKKYCMIERTGAIKMESGEVLPRYLTIEDNERINKMCDCMVEKSYAALGEPAIVSNLRSANLDSDMIEFLKYMLMGYYKICEYEMLEILDKKYKPVNIEM